MSWEIRIYDMDKFWAEKFDEMKLIKVVELVPEFGKNLLIDGKTYRSCASSPVNKILGVEKITFSEEVEDQDDSEFICPYCHEVELDAWELSDSGTTDCSHCGSEIEYEKEYEVTYIVKPIKKNQPIEV